MCRDDVYCLRRLYRSPGFWLVLELERDNATFHTALVGHLGERRDPLTPLARAEVRMVSGGRVVATTESDQQGEFKLEYEPTADTALSIVAGDRELARVSVD
jgi:hypothetical protein